MQVWKAKYPSNIKRGRFYTKIGEGYYFYDERPYYNDHSMEKEGIWIEVVRIKHPEAIPLEETLKESSPLEFLLKVGKPITATLDKLISHQAKVQEASGRVDNVDY